MTDKTVKHGNINAQDSTWYGVKFNSPWPSWYGPNANGILAFDLSVFVSLENIRHLDNPLNTPP